MGIFDLFKKKEKDNQEPISQMLELKSREEPHKKDEAEQQKQKKDISIELQTVPEPITLQSPTPEPEDEVHANLQTTSVEKKHLDHVPSVKKLIIPAHDDTSSQLVQPNDSIIVENPKKLTQVSLQNSADSLVPPPQSDVIIGEGINIPLSLIITAIPSQFLADNALQSCRDTESIRFSKEEILPILSQGVFAVMGSALLKRLPAGLATKDINSVTEVFNIPLDSILPLVPPEWFMLQGQDTSVASSLDGISNPFADAFSNETSQEAKPDTTQESPKPIKTQADDAIDLNIEEEDVEEAFNLDIEEEDEEDYLETVAQKAIPQQSVDTEEDEDYLETVVQKTIPQQAILSSSEIDTVTEDRKSILSETTFDDILKIPASRFQHIVRNAHCTLNIPKGKVLSCLNEGHFILSKKELAEFGGIQENSIMSNEDRVDIGLENVIDIIPPEWLEVQKQDTRQTDAVSNMSNLFDENAIAAEESSAEEETPQVATAKKETPKPPAQAPANPAPKSSSLITGDFTGGKSSLFDDEDDEDEEDEEIAIDIPEEIEDEPVVIKIEEDEEIAIDIPEEIEDEPVVIKIEEDEEDEEDEEIAIDIPEEIEKQVHTPTSPQTLLPPKEVSTKPIESSGEVTKKQIKRPLLSGSVTNATQTKSRPSRAPNGIDINRSNLKDLCQLHFTGEKLAQAIIDYREEHGPFERINDLINVPGVGTSVYKALTGLRPSADLEAGERRINKHVDLSTDKDHSLGKIIEAASQKFNFQSLILSGKDGFEICSTGDKSLLESNSELLAAATPQLFKKTKHFLKQANLPHPEVFTFYLEDKPVTFGIADEVFLVMVHNTSWPDAKHMKNCSQLIDDLAWYCSYRAVT